MAVVVEAEAREACSRWHASTSEGGQMSTCSARFMVTACPAARTERSCCSVPQLGRCGGERTVAWARVGAAGWAAAAAAAAAAWVMAAVAGGKGAAWMPLRRRGLA